MKQMEKGEERIKSYRRMIKPISPMNRAERRLVINEDSDSDLGR
jgi:hypothetical protein